MANPTNFPNGITINPNGGPSPVAVIDSSGNAYFSGDVTFTSEKGNEKITGTLEVTGAVILDNKITQYNAVAPTDGQLLVGGTAAGNFTAATLTGTANQITVTNGNNTVTLALPSSVQLTGGTLADQGSAFTVTATQPASPTGTQKAVVFTVTSAGSAAQVNIGAQINYTAGYTGASRTSAFEAFNSAAGTGSTLALGSGSNTPTGNASVLAQSTATTSGLNIGASYTAVNGNTNAAMAGYSNTAKAGATNIGVFASAINTGGGGAVEIGGYFTLGNATLPTVSAALMADNGAETTSPIFVGRSNGNTIFNFSNAAVLSLGRNATAGGSLALLGSTSGTVTVAVAAAAGTYTINLPTAQGAANQQLANDGSGNLSWVDAGGSLSGVVSVQFDKTTDTTLANITGLSVTVTAARKYAFRAVVHVSPDATGGHKYAIAGTATATNIIYQVNSINNAAAFVINSRQTALGGSAGAAGGTVIYTEIVGTITVNAGGTLTVQFAQNASSGTSSVLVGSNFILADIT